MNKERVLIIKLSEIKNETGWLKDRVSGAWRINLDTIIKKNITHVVAMYQQKVVADYSLGNKEGYHLAGVDTGRVWFDLVEYEGSSPLKGKQFDYKTANPATTKDLQKLLELEVK